MLYQINLANGFAQMQGVSKHLKIISAASPVKLEVVAVGNRSGRVLMSSTNVRAPMGFVLPEDAGTVNFYGEDQTLEIWSGEHPLEYLQLTAVGASGINSAAILAYSGVTKVANKNQRKSIMLKSSEALKVGTDGGGWPVAANEVINLETVSDINVYREKPGFNVNAIGTDVVVSNTVQRKDHASIARFAGLTWAVTAAGELFKYDNTGAQVGANQTGSAGFTKAALIWAFNGALYIAGSGLSGIMLVKTTDGETYNLLGNAGAGTFTAVPERTNFYRGIMSGSNYSSSIVVADLVAETIAQRPLRNNNTSRVYGSNGDFDYEIDNQGLWVRPVDLSAPWQQVNNTDWRNATISENSGQPIAVSNSNFKVHQLNNDGTTTVLSSSNMNTTETLSNYINVGVDGWKSGNNLYFFADGLELVKPTTVIPGTAMAAYDPANELYWVTGYPASDNTIAKIPFNQQLAIEPARVNVLEFLI